MSDTPITDANVCITTKEGCETIAPDICRKFERENAAMREAIRDSDAALRKCLNYMLGIPISGSEAECEAMDDAHHALRKTKPFLKP